MQIIKRLAIAGTSVLASLSMIVAPVAAAPAFELETFEFVGTAEQCGGVAGTDTVTAEWVEAEGNDAPSIKLEKLGDTANCAAAGVEITTPLVGGPVAELNSLSFEYQDGGHCGAGAPRFNIQTETGTAITLGCTSGTPTSLGDGWTRVEFSEAQIDTAVATAGGGTTLEALYIIFDEGDDVVSPTITTPGTVLIDNVDVNGEVVGAPEEEEPEPVMPTSKDQCKKGGWETFGVFKNQGDCVSYVATGGTNLASF